eukprot:TRINITY_DN9735_c0_g1_i3.p4 TRINITY_DN9735_c0_g1~~TRINITY_DN9735_c0_g1_i3.p4  ORF type:complete len:131 (+),score=12.70 TRINITY_DN9735_c0_g1_i3:2922-3314(+)
MDQVVANIGPIFRFGQIVREIPSCFLSIFGIDLLFASIWTGLLTRSSWIGHDSIEQWQYIDVDACHLNWDLHARNGSDSCCSRLFLHAREGAHEAIYARNSFQSRLLSVSFNVFISLRMRTKKASLASFV